MTILELENLAFAWPLRTPLWQYVSLSLRKGQNIGITGGNGVGKTTLFRCITGLLPITEGKIIFAGRSMCCNKDFQSLRRQVGFCLQQAEEQLIFPEVTEDICFGPLNMGLSVAEARQIADEVMVQLGISHLAGRETFQLSGGEQRLVALAGMLALRPRVLILDEPLTALDEGAATRVTELLETLDCAKIIVAHDFVFLQSLCERVLELTPQGLVNLE